MTLILHWENLWKIFTGAAGELALPDQHLSRSGNEPDKSYLSRVTTLVSYLEVLGPGKPQPGEYQDIQND
jgi:hypothetical protein